MQRCEALFDSKANLSEGALSWLACFSQKGLSEPSDFFKKTLLCSRRVDLDSCTLPDLDVKGSPSAHL